ncbi:MAG: hypothetical protein QXV64_03605 [Candidatus Anstonellaceae archaeon]
MQTNKTQQETLLHTWNLKSEPSIVQFSDYLNGIFSFINQKSGLQMNNLNPQDISYIKVEKTQDIEKITVYKKSGDPLTFIQTKYGFIISSGKTEIIWEGGKNLYVVQERERKV